MKHCLFVPEKLNVAVFEETGKDEMTVSASLSYTNMKSREKMTKDEARAFYRELCCKGWVKPDAKTAAKFTHSYVYRIYD